MWRHPFLRGGVFGYLKCRRGRWHGHAHRAVYICFLTNLTGLRYLSEIQKEALLSESRSAVHQLFETSFQDSLGHVGLATLRLTAECSTIELPGNIPIV